MVMMNRQTNILCQKATRIVRGKTQGIVDYLSNPSIWPDTYYLYMLYAAKSNEEEFKNFITIRENSRDGYFVNHSEGDTEDLTYKEFDLKYPQYAGNHKAQWELSKAEEPFNVDCCTFKGDIGFYFTLDTVKKDYEKLDALVLDLYYTCAKFAGCLEGGWKNDKIVHLSPKNTQKVKDYMLSKYNQSLEKDEQGNLQFLNGLPFKEDSTLLEEEFTLQKI
jgi:hypothetical protein